MYPPQSPITRLLFLKTCIWVGSKLRLKVFTDPLFLNQCSTITLSFPKEKYVFPQGWNITFVTILLCMFVSWTSSSEWGSQSFTVSFNWIELLTIRLLYGCQFTLLTLQICLSKVLQGRNFLFFLSFSISSTTHFLSASPHTTLFCAGPKLISNTPSIPVSIFLSQMSLQFNSLNMSMKEKIPFLSAIKILRPSSKH